uniref:Ig-like domain-containing protein n=1 Tax=Hucho hucho TaxID=62062 RepID=A0A4W5MXC4_9TELE
MGKWCFRISNHNANDDPVCSLYSVLSNSPSTQKAPISLTCHLSDTSEVTEYEWVQVTYDLNGTQSESSVQKGRVLGINRVSDRNSGEWACRFHGKEGALGSVTYHVHLMSGLMGDNETGSSSNVAMAAGLGFFLLVLLLVLVQMYRNYRRVRSTTSVFSLNPH